MNMTSIGSSNSTSEDSYKTIIYDRGNPFYKLTDQEAAPVMNLNKNFDSLEPNLTDFLKGVENNQWSDVYTELLLILLTDVKKFAKSRDFQNCQTAAIFEIFYSCFKYFALLPAINKDQFCVYFRETLLMYSIRDPPERLRIFNSIEGFAIAKLFHQLIVNNFELIRYVLVPVYEIEISKE